MNRSTAAPFAFRIYAAYEVDSVLSDKRLHSVLDKLKRTNEKVYLGVSETLVKRSELFNYKSEVINFGRMATKTIISRYIRFVGFF